LEAKKEKSVYLAILKRGPAAKATRILNLYLSIRAGKKIFTADLKGEERRDVLILSKAGLIRYESTDSLGKPRIIAISAQPVDPGEKE
jgi:hypothetical protein